MKDSTASRPSIMRLIFIPSVISLIVTVLRLVGELERWSATWFSPASGGIVPSGMSWLIGITWLALPFGAYFAWKLASTGQAPASLGKAFGCVVAGLLVVIAGLFFLSPLVPLGFPSILLYIWAVMAIAAAIQWFAWPELFKILLAYGLAARIPVVIVMILAMRGNWGTHYDFADLPPELDMNLLPKILWLAVFPQLVFWVGFTILMGMLAGVITFAVVRRNRVTTRTAAA